MSLFIGSSGYCCGCLSGRRVISSLNPSGVANGRSREPEEIDAVSFIKPRAQKLRIVIVGLMSSGDITSRINSFSSKIHDFSFNEEAEPSERYAENASWLNLLRKFCGGGGEGEAILRGP